MKTFVYGAAVALASIAIAPSVSAAPFIVPLVQNGTHYTADYGNDGVDGSFTDTFTFTPSLTKSMADISLIQVGHGMAAITFTELKLDGYDLLPFLQTSSQGSVLMITDHPLSGGLHVLTVGGTAGDATGGDASYAGTVNFVLSPIPEPATWSLMLAGVFTIGIALRSRARVTRIAYS